MAQRTSLRAQFPVCPQKPCTMQRSQPIMAGVSLLSIVLLAVLALALPGRAADTPGYSYARIVRVSYVEGDVQIVRADKSNKWEPAAMNMPVEQGFALGSNVGRAEVEFENGSMLWLAPNSVVQFTELALSNGGRITRITLSEGVASFDANLSAGDTFEVSTPLFSVTPNKNAEFRMGVRGKAAGVSVLKGRVTVGASGTTQEVAKGDMFVEESGKPPKTATMKNPATDQWDHWVDSRLTAERNGATQAALNTNAPFNYGMADLADYGSWSFFPGFGYGWQPWGTAAGWAPFMDGQWMFYPTFGWTWISSEPWGWVPYHFGNWDFSPTFGWMWIPGDYGLWDAAPVEWYSVGGRMGWTPRGIRLPRTTPVIVGTKELGKEGRNRVLNRAEVSAKMQSLKMRSLAMAPAEDGKPSLTAARVSAARVVIPTAENLETLRAGLAANAGASVRINALREAVPSREQISRFPRPGFTAVNAAMAAPRIPNRPPMRVMYATPRIGEDPYSAERSGPISTLSAPSMAAPQAGAVAVPAGSAHPASAGGGKPR
jgi:FecR protein